jgi:hypothetical protein
LQAAVHQRLVGTSFGFKDRYKKVRRSSLFFFNPIFSVTRRAIKLPIFKQARNSQYKKASLTVLDKIFFFYNFNHNFSLLAVKIFTYMELLLFSILTSAQLIKYVYLIKILCFYRLVFVNQQPVKNAFVNISLFDTVMVYNKIHYYFYYQQLQHHYFASTLVNYFKIY